MPTWRPRKRASASSSRALKGVPLTTTSPLSGRSSPAITISKVDFPEPEGPIRPIASPDATRRLISLRMWTRAAPAPSERLTFEMEMVSGSRPASDEGSMRLSMARSYGTSGSRVERQAAMFVHMLVLGLVLMAGTAFAQSPAAAMTKPIKLVILGDSLSAGLGLSASSAFPERLQKSLEIKGITVDMINAGVSGDTSSGGRDRLDWSVPEGTQAVIVELGAHDALRGTDPAVTRAALSDILTRLKARKIAVLLCGMVAPPNYGSDYSARFNAIYPDLAKSFGVPLYPFFLEGVAADAGLNQADGLHPTAEGVDVIVRNIPVSYTHLRAHETRHDLVCRLLLEKKKK